MYELLIFHIIFNDLKLLKLSFQLFDHTNLTIRVSR